MKYVVILGDGMADYKDGPLNGKTPLEIANKPFIDSLVKKSETGLLQSVPFGMKPGSDVANLSVLGYDPKECYTGRSPLEAASIGIALKDTDVTARANLVTLSDEEKFEDKKMIDYSAGEISTAEAKELIEYLASKLNDEKYSLYAGVSYRHCLVMANGVVAGDFTPPHDITGKPIKEYLPKSEEGLKGLELMKKSYELLKDHPINLARIKAGKNPASSLWLWGEGTKPALQNFKERFNLNGGIISAVDLLKGIGKLADMKVIEVEGATGNYDTNFIGKAKATVDALKGGLDFLYLHMEAPDECGHRGEAENKVKAIELIEKRAFTSVFDYLENSGGDFRILIMPDHPTPLKIMTHSPDPVPYLIYDSRKTLNGVDCFTEANAEKTGNFVEHGPDIMGKLLEKI